MYSNRAQFETIRSVAAGSVTASYVALGGPLLSQCVAFSLVNETNGDVQVSFDGTNTNLTAPPNSYAVWDVRTNSPALNEYVLAGGTQFYVKQGTTVPTTGNFYVEVMTLNTAHS
jgi:hypothetical protein